jgi:DNA adenine methylase
MNSPITLIGGKSRLAKQIIKYFPDHSCYCEPFAGGAQVFFRKPPSKVEVLNDLDGEIVNLYRVCQSHPEELMRCLRYHLISRQWFELIKRADPSSLTDIQRASRFFYLQRAGFGGRMLNPNYGHVVHGSQRLGPGRFPFLIEAAHRRLHNVQIECLPYEQILEKYDHTNTLFYLDPPYLNRRYYRHNFAEKDFVTLASRLAKLRGTFVLSINDSPVLRQLFRRFEISPVELTYTCKRHARHRLGQEILIHNLKL